MIPQVDCFIPVNKNTQIQTLTHKMATTVNIVKTALIISLLEYFGDGTLKHAQLCLCRCAIAYDCIYRHFTGPVTAMGLMSAKTLNWSERPRVRAF